MKPQIRRQYTEPGAVMHLSYMPPVTSEHQFHCPRLYSAVARYSTCSPALVSNFPKRITLENDNRKFFFSIRQTWTDSWIRRKKHSAAPPDRTWAGLPIAGRTPNHWATAIGRPRFDPWRGCAVFFFVWSSCQFTFVGQKKILVGRSVKPGSGLHVYGV